MTIQMRVPFATLGTQIMDAVDAELEDAAEEIKFLAQELVPVDTGFLRSSIHAERIDHLAVQVRADAEYAAFVEYGTSKMAAQPYMTPAIEAVRAGYTARIARAIEEVLG